MALTHHKGMSLTPDPRGSTALEVTGTTSITGNPTVTGNLTVSGNATLGRPYGNANWAGVRKISTGGSSSVSSTYVTATGPIIVTPTFQATTGTAPRRRLATVTNRVAGTKFKILLSTPSGTAAAGTVMWQIIGRT